MNLDTANALLPSIRANQKSGRCRMGSSPLKMKTRKKPCFIPEPQELTAPKIQAFLADDSPIMTALLAGILSKDERITIVGRATDGWEAVCFASTLRPDLVIVDLHMPGLNGAEVTRHLKHQPNPPAVIVVTSDGSPELRAKCRAAGADGFLLKMENLPTLLRAAIRNFFPANRPDLAVKGLRPLNRRPPVSGDSAKFRKTSPRPA